MDANTKEAYKRRMLEAKQRHDERVLRSLQIYNEEIEQVASSAIEETVQPNQAVQLATNLPNSITGYMDANTKEAYERRMLEAKQRHDERVLRSLQIYNEEIEQVASSAIEAETVQPNQEVQPATSLLNLPIAAETVQPNQEVQSAATLPNHPIADKICHGGAVPCDRLVKFVKYLRIAEIEPDGILSVPGDVCIGGVSFLEFLHGKLLVRKCYEELFDILLNEGMKKVIIKGNPGIGKSLFSYYIIYRLIKLGKTIVWQPASLPDVVCITPTAAHFATNLYEFRSQLNNQATWYIVDGKVPEHFDATTIVMTSSDSVKYNKFEKIGAEIRYMPVWSWSEIEKAHKAGVALAETTTELELPLIDHLYRKWGGIPRYLFQYARDQGRQSLLDAAIDHADLVKLCAFIGGQSDDSISFSHELMHIEVDTGCTAGDGRFRKYERMIVVFASDFVRNKVFENLPEQLRDCMLARQETGSQVPVLKRKRVADATKAQKNRTSKRRKFGDSTAASCSKDVMRESRELKAEEEV